MCSLFVLTWWCPLNPLHFPSAPSSSTTWPTPSEIPICIAVAVIIINHQLVVMWCCMLLHSVTWCRRWWYSWQSTYAMIMSPTLKPSGAHRPKKFPIWLDPWGTSIFVAFLFPMLPQLCKYFIWIAAVTDNFIELHQTPDPGSMLIWPTYPIIIIIMHIAQFHHFPSEARRLYPSSPQFNHDDGWQN